MLDLWQRNQEIASQPQPGEARDLPATAGEAFETAWTYGRQFGQSIARSNARAAVLDDYIGEVRKKTGTDLSKEFMPDVAGGGQTGVTNFDAANERVAKLKADNPNLDIAPLDDDEIEKRTIAKSRKAMTNYEAMAAREKTTGGSLGFFGGSLASTAADPINLLALPVAPAEGLGLLATALRWGAITTTTQAAIEAAGAPFHEAVQPGYEASGAPAGNILEAAVGGAVLGGAIKALGNTWTRVKSGKWPTSVRDAGNVVESESHTAQSNIYPGIEGEVAHGEALAKTIDDIVKGKPADVTIAPEVQAASDARVAPIIDAIEGANKAARDAEAERAAPTGLTPELPFKATALAANEDAAVSRIADHVQEISRGEAPRSPVTLKPVEPREALHGFRSYDIAAADGSKLADLDVVDHGEQLEIGWVGPSEDAPLYLDLGPGKVRAVLDQLSKLYPDAKFVTGTRISGARSPLGDAMPEVTVPLRRRAQSGGYDMPREQAEAAARTLMKTEPEQARALLNHLTVSPQSTGDALAQPNMLAKLTAAQAEETAIRGDARAAMLRDLATPEHQEALRADIDRARMTTDRKIPVGVDEKGEPVYRNLDAAMEEVDAYKAAAEQIQLCANPAPEPVESAA